MCYLFLRDLLVNGLSVAESKPDEDLADQMHHEHGIDIHKELPKLLGLETYDRGNRSVGRRQIQRTIQKIWASGHDYYVWFGKLGETWGHSTVLRWHNNNPTFFEPAHGAYQAPNHEQTMVGLVLKKN